MSKKPVKIELERPRHACTCLLASHAGLKKRIIKSTLKEIRLLISMTLLLLCLSAVLRAAEDSKPHFGPYVQAVTPTGAVICWVEGIAEVKIGTLPDQLETGARNYVRHDVVLENLKPATRYYYSVFQNQDKRGAGQFVTAPSGAAPFTFAVYGDSRTRPAIHRQIAERIAAAKPALVLHTGDFVARGRMTNEWGDFFDSASSLIQTVPLYPALGNHEDDSPFYYQFFLLPGKKNYYSFDWGDVHFICLDSNPPYRAAGAFASEEAYRRKTEEHWKTQQEWLIQDLVANRKAGFTIVYFHHPPYSTNTKRKANQEEMQRIFARILEKYQVDAVFSGHDHNYQHNLVNGVHYLVSGGGGAPLYDIEKGIPGVTLKLAQVEHYLLATVTPEKIAFEAMDLNGKQIDYFEISGKPRPASR
jgi:predicted phosphodiesterase